MYKSYFEVKMVGYGLKNKKTNLQKIAWNEKSHICQCVRFIWLPNVILVTDLVC